MLTPDQVTITPESEPFFRAALNILVENRTELEGILATEPIPFDVEGCKFELTKPEEVGQVIGILREKLGIGA